MQFTLLPVSLLLSLAAAQTTSYSYTAVTSTACAAQDVLEACIASTTAIAQGCASTDYNCLCQKYTDVLTCYNQCPNDAGQPAALSTKETYCNDAAVYTSSTPIPVSSNPVSATTSSGAEATATNAENTSSGAVRTATGTSSTTGFQASASSTAKSDAAGKMGAGSVLMGVVGVMGALL